VTWYTRPEALALLDSFTRRPRVLKAKNSTWCADFTGKRYSELGTLWLEDHRDGDASPWHVLGALWGDPNSSGYPTHWDASGEWAAIRRRLSTTKGRAARRAIRRQKELS
jgi:hypothetical protein